uniref:acyltransferase family protein n=1 Tax=Enterobacter hormaechei TaxID=158836 RepID=UPI003561C1E2
MTEHNKYYLSALDHLRFYAAIMVVFRHFFDLKSIPLDKNPVYDFIWTWIKAGATGVSLFLVISGFIFTVLCLGGKREIIYSKFLKNRILRIFPLLTVIYFIIISMNLDHATPDDILRLLLLKLNTGGLAWGMDKFSVYPIWTIAVEFQFYLIFPFLIIFINRIGLRYIAFLMLALFLIRVMMISKGGVTPTGEILYRTLFGRLDQFLLGILAGLAYLNGSFDYLKKRKILCMSIISVVIIALTSYFSVRLDYLLAMNYFGFIFESTMWSMFLIAYLSLFDKPLGNFSLFLSNLGKVSFSIYLLHVPVISTLKRVLTVTDNLDIANSPFFLPLVGIPVTLVVSAVTYAAFEKPFMSLKCNYFK